MAQLRQTREELYGGEPDATTNNRMELMAAIQALEALTRSAVVRLHTDSAYLRNGITAWLARWKENGWRTRDKQPVKNADLWQRLAEAMAHHEVEWLWVKGHAGFLSMNAPTSSPTGVSRRPGAPASGSVAPEPLPPG
jgi:ribonuclease HI